MGISISNPTFVYVKKVTDYRDTSNTILGVDITGICEKYGEGNGDFRYYFTDDGLVVLGFLVVFLLEPAPQEKAKCVLFLILAVVMLALYCICKRFGKPDEEGKN